MILVGRMIETRRGKGMMGAVLDCGITQIVILGSEALVSAFETGDIYNFSIERSASDTIEQVKDGKG